MTDGEIEILRAVIKNAQVNGSTLVWRDVDGGIHEVIGFAANFKEHPEDHLGEPVAVLKHGYAAVHNTEMDCFYFMLPAFRHPPEKTS